jgi:hypothetical protein
MDSRVYQVLFDANGNPTTGYQATAPAIVKSITVGRDTKGNPEVFAIGRSSRVFALDFNADGTLVRPWYTLVTPGQVRSIIVAQNGNPATNGNPVIFAVGLDSQVYESVAAARLRFSTWTLVAPGEVQSIAAGENHNDFTIHLFAIGLNNAVSEVNFNASAQPTTDWYQTRPRQVQQISVGNDSNGNVELFAIGLLDSRVYGLDFNPNGTPAAPYFLIAPGRARSISQTVPNVTGGEPEVFITRFDDQVWASTATGLQTFGPYVLVAPGRALEGSMSG